MYRCTEYVFVLTGMFSPNFRIVRMPFSGMPVGGPVTVGMPAGGAFVSGAGMGNNGGIVVNGGFSGGKMAGGKMGRVLLFFII